MTSSTLVLGFGVGVFSVDCFIYLGGGKGSVGALCRGLQYADAIP